MIVNQVNNIQICDACLDGKGGECHTPGCIFIYSVAPDIPKRQLILDCGGTIIPLMAIGEDNDPR